MKDVRQLTTDELKQHLAEARDKTAKIAHLGHKTGQTPEFWKMVEIETAVAAELRRRSYR